MAGILTACLLQEKGISCVVFAEANRIGSGQTRHTTAKVTSQHNLIYDRLLRSRGKEIAKQYAQANEAAIENYRRLIVSRNIDCDWRESTAYLYTMQNTAALERECAAAKSLGICAEMIAVPENAGKPEIPIPAEAVLSFAGQAQFHPLKFLASIANEVKVYEHSRVLQVDEEEVILADGRVRAEHIVLAAHYPFVNVPGYYFLKMHQERSYVLALQETGKCRKEESSLGKLKGMYIGIDKGGFRFGGGMSISCLAEKGTEQEKMQRAGSIRDLRVLQPDTSLKSELQQNGRHRTV